MVSIGNADNIYKIGKKIFGKDSIMAKRREAKLQRDARRFEKLKNRFETSGTGKVDTETLDTMCLCAIKCWNTWNLTL